MANVKKQHEEFGPVITCGAVGVSLSHEPGDPTSIDNMVAAVKRFFKHERVSADATTRVRSDHRTTAAHGTTF